MSKELMWWRRRQGPAPTGQFDPEETAPASNVTRRVFLRNGSLTVAAAGVLGAVPGLPALLSEIAPDAPAADATAASELASGTLADALVVQVRDLQTGEMSLYLGEREIVYRDPGLASRILRATG
jgi:hypothetical protein